MVFFGLEKSATLSPDTLKFPVPDLVVEVLSDSTEARDRGVKFDDFAANGVKEYWIVNDELVIEQFVLVDGEYSLAMKSGSDVLNCRAIQGLTIPVEALFDEQANLQAIRKLLGN